MVIIEHEACFSIDRITGAELASLQRLIVNSSLPDKRDWYEINKQISQINF